MKKVELNTVEWIYSPRDLRKNPYFIVSKWVFRRNNTWSNKCILSESDYEAMCDTYWVNPIYIDNVPVDQLRIYKEPAQKKEDVYDRIRKRRAELWHKI